MALVTGTPLVIGSDYNEHVEAAVASFQRQRGLRVDGVCSKETWARLVEAGYRLGDRLLYRRSPMLRGDDIAELQARAGSLGFDAGRVDGIYGDETAAAVADFQRNVGLPADGRCGHATVRELLRLRTPDDLSAVVAGLKERDRLRRGHLSLTSASFVLAHPGGLGAFMEALRRALAAAGASVVMLEHPNGSRLAGQANRTGAQAFLYFGADPDHLGCSTAYYASYRWESPGGRRLAEDLGKNLSPALELPYLASRGMSVPVLRETRMPAVICEIGPTAHIVQRSEQAAATVVHTLRSWLAGGPQP